MFFKKEHFQIIDLNTNENEYLELVVLERTDDKEISEQISLNILYVKPDYFISVIKGGDHSGCFAICYFTDYCKESYMEFCFKVGQSIVVSKEQLIKLTMNTQELRDCLSEFPVDI